MYHCMEHPSYEVCLAAKNDQCNLKPALLSHNYGLNNYVRLCLNVLVKSKAIAQCVANSWELHGCSYVE